MSQLYRFPLQLHAGETGGGGVRVGTGLVVGTEVGFLVGDIVRVGVGVFVAVVKLTLKQGTVPLHLASLDIQNGNFFTRGSPPTTTEHTN